MKSPLKKKIALMLLEVLKRKGLKLGEWSPKQPPVFVDDCQETQDFLGRIGYEFVTGRRLQVPPKDTSKEIYLKMAYESENVIWVRMDTAMKSLALGFLPESAESDS